MDDELQDALKRNDFYKLAKITYERSGNENRGETD